MKGPETIPVAARDYLDARRAYLIQFVTRHYGRRETTVREDYAASLYFLDGRLADANIEANRKSKTIETFLAGDGDEIDVAVKNVSIEDLRTPPYKATVDFEKIHFTRHDRLETRTGSSRSTRWV